MDITAVFGTAIPGSNPGGSTRREIKIASYHNYGIIMALRPSRSEK
jgi:hypothetical protein